MVPWTYPVMVGDPVTVPKCIPLTAYLRDGRLEV